MSSSVKCSICLGSRDASFSVLGACGHVYHTSCVQSWLRQPGKQWCPQCKVRRPGCSSADRRGHDNTPHAVSLYQKRRRGRSTSPDPSLPCEPQTSLETCQEGAGATVL